MTGTDIRSSLTRFPKWIHILSCPLEHVWVGPVYVTPNVVLNTLRNVLRDIGLVFSYSPNTPRQETGRGVVTAKKGPSDSTLRKSSGNHRTSIRGKKKWKSPISTRGVLTSRHRFLTEEVLLHTVWKHTVSSREKQNHSRKNHTSYSWSLDRGNRWEEKRYIHSSSVRFRLSRKNIEMIDSVSRV